MAFFCPQKYAKKFPNLNEEFRKLEGELDDRTAKITLIRFMRANLRLAVQILLGIRLYPFQVINLKAMMNRNFSLLVWGRGAGKSFIAGIFCILTMILNPGSKIVIAAPVFRTARLIFMEMERHLKKDEAKMARACFKDENKSCRSDIFTWEVNGGTVSAVPLSGEKLRGLRASTIIIDEFLLVNEQIVKEVLMPFLVVPTDMATRTKIRELEQQAIKEGRMSEEDSVVFKSDAKMIAMSSASYTFQYLFRIYEKWKEKIQYADTSKEESTYFVSQMSWEAIPPDMQEKSVIDEAKSGGLHNPSFLREYCARFINDSEGYFSAKKMEMATVPNGSHPHLKLVGNKNTDYILSIDPNASNSTKADFFAMCVMELDHETKQPTVVHNYATAGADLSDVVKYFTYIIDNFNIVLIILDNAGGSTFIDACNLSEHMKSRKIAFSFIDYDSMAEGQDFVDMTKKARNQYNKDNHRICIKQVFTSDWIRTANENLQTNIDYRRIWFGSKIRPVEIVFNNVASCSEVLDPKLFEVKEEKDQKAQSIGSMIDNQDFLIDEVKNQCAMIEVSATMKGTQTFDLPASLRSRGAKRARKDNYTCLLLANWGNKCYYDIMTSPEKSVRKGFIPRVFGTW